MQFLEIFRIWEPLLLGALLVLIPTTTLRALMADTLRNGYFRTRSSILWAAGGLLCIAYFFLYFLALISSRNFFFASIACFGSLVLGSFIIDLWKIDSMPEEEPLFSSRRMFFTSWHGFSYWLICMSIIGPNAEIWWPEQEWTKWMYPFAFIVGWIATFLVLSFNYDQRRFFFQGTDRVSWLFKGNALLLLFLMVRFFIRSISILMQNGFFA